MAMEVKLGRVFDSMPAMVWSALPDGTIDYLNRRWFTYTGVRATEAEQWDWTAVIHPEDMRAFIDHWGAILASGNAGDLECRVRRSDGEYRWFSIDCSPAHDDAGHLARWYGIAKDVEDLRRAETTVKSRERDLEEVFNSIPMPAALLDPSGEVKSVNQAALDFFGRTLGQLKDWKTAGVIHPDDLQRTIEAQRDAHEDASIFNVESRCRRTDGVYRWFNVLGVPLRSSEDVVLRWLYLLIDAEDRKRAEAVLRESEQRSRLIVDSIPGMVAVFRANGELEFVNQQVLAYYGVTLDELAQWDTGELVHPDDRHRAISAFEHSVASGEPFEIEVRSPRFDGVYRWVQSRGLPLKDDNGHIVRWYNLLTDIDERKRTEDELAASEERLRRSEAFLAEGQHLARMGNLSWNVSSGQIVWSEPLYRIFEFEPGTLVTLDRIAAMIPPEDLPMMVDMVDRAQRGESDFEYQHRIVLGDSRIKYLHLIAHRTKDVEQLEYVGAVLDVTQRRVSEEALEKVRSELSNVTRIMSLGALTASIAHEVNQPLSGIVTNAGTCLRMLSTDPPNIEVAKETARRTIRDGNRAADIITQLRSLFGRKAIARQTIDLNEAAQEVLALIANDLRRGHVVLKTEFADRLPLVRGDRIQLQQVMMNLLRNAIDAMQEIDDRPRLLGIKTEPVADDQVKLTVRDVGAGFGTEDPDRIFQAFYTTKSGGMGIGLSVSRSIIESHGGRLWAETNDGPGASLAFTIPEHAGGEAAMPAGDATKSPASIAVS